MQNKAGYAMPYDPDDFGIAISEVIYPSYSLGLIVGTIIIVMVTATIVSYMPARKIAKMNPTDAIKGKIQ
jgi:ABC-type antimicrobial peptide transport system permease subunit